MNSISAQNLEDAANIATEFVYSLDNLPNEVKHLLEEILHKENKVQQLQQQIDSDSKRYIRHTLHGTTPLSISASPSPSPSPSTKNVSHLPQRIKQAYAEIDQLSEEKIAISQHIIEHITRTTTRLEIDLNKVRQLQGDTQTDLYGKGGFSAAPTLSASDITRGSGLSGRDPASSISESLRIALNGASSTPEKKTTAADLNPPPTKRRRTTTTASPSIKLPPTKSRSISPAAPAVTKTTSHSRSRLSRQIHPVPDEPELASLDDDAEGEEDTEGDDEDADDKLYCFCQKTSYGDMIACDNEGGCPYEWFHLSCVGLSKPLPDVWYCSVCVGKMSSASNSNRKGRKK